MRIRPTDSGQYTDGRKSMMRGLFFRPWIMMLLPLLMLGCAEAQRPSDYFPLKSGNQWLYHIAIDQSHAAGRSLRDMVANLDPVTFSSGEKTYQLIPQRHASGLIYYYYHDKGNIIRLGMQRPGHDGIAFDSGTHTVLPDTLEIGQTWKVDLGTRLILKRAALIRYPLDAPGVKHNLLFSLKYQLTSIDDTVRVKAGVFHNCLKVQAKSHILIPRDNNPLADPIRLEIESIQWYAPGVGLVRWLYQENTPTRIFGNNRMEVTLEQFDSASIF